VTSDAQSWFERRPNQSIDAFSLSNICELMSADETARLFTAVRRSAQPGARAFNTASENCVTKKSHRSCSASRFAAMLGDMTAPTPEPSQLAIFGRRIAAVVVLTIFAGLAYQAVGSPGKSSSKPGVKPPAIAAVVVPNEALPIVRQPLRGPPPGGPPADPSPASRWVVTEQGIGPITVDQSADSAEARLGAYFKVVRDVRGCSWAVWPTAPVGVTVLIDGNHVVGVMVDSGEVETSAHMKIGSSEAEVWRAYYPPNDSIAAVRRDPRKHDMLITPINGQATYEMVFTIVNGAVVSYRAGNLGEMRHRQQC
jgi:hypothetical protein